MNLDWCSFCADCPKIRNIATFVITTYTNFLVNVTFSKYYQPSLLPSKNFSTKVSKFVTIAT